MSRLFLASEEIASGRITRRDLRRSYAKVFQGVYRRSDTELTAVDRAVAAWLWSNREATVAGHSAAALLGSRWLTPDVPVELIRPEYRSPAGIIIHADALAGDETCTIDGIRCTTAARTAYDMGRRLPFTEGLIRTDALLNATRLPVSAVHDIAQRYPGARNIRRLRDVIAIADGGAESPQETRVRLILIRGGLPRPETQIPIGWRRIDMGWEQWKVGVEYDGPQHWLSPDQIRADIERHELFATLGWRIVRVVADHVRLDPQGIVNRAARALAAAGWSPKL